MSTPTRPRRATKLKATSLVVDSDSEDEMGEWEASPPPRKPASKVVKIKEEGKSRGKRRVSDIHASPRMPLAEVDLNDDAAERRARRQSFKRSTSVRNVEEHGPKVERINSDKSVTVANASMVANTTANKSTRVAALAMVNGGGHQISSVAPQVPPPSLQILSSNFEEWMKMATDNKINATNSWHFALIDYFHDMSLLRNELDNSINFQKASCTLDGCVKIWTSRVDSVATETGKLLSGLADDGRDAAQADEDGNEEGAGDGEEGVAKAKRRTHRTEATLAKSYAQLQVKKFDLEFTVDPLFKKTSADFDEGGAMGLLMNHLGVDGSLRIVFDASDCKLEEDDVEEELSEMKGAEVDLSSLRAKYFPSMDILGDRAISSTLSDFKFSADQNLDLAFLNLDRTETETPAPGAGDAFGDDGANGGTGEDFFTGDQAVEDDAGGWGGGGGWGGDDDNGPGGDAGDGEPHAPSGSSRVAFGGVESFDPRHPPNERALVMALGEGEGALDYFDQNLLKNWAGPEHWKMRKVIRKVTPDSSTAANKASKAEKKAFEIDFTTPAPSAKQLFAPSGRAAISLPGSKAPGKRKRSSRTKAPAVKRDEHLLPDDMHFNSAQLLRLFMKPKFALRMRRQGHVINEEDGEVDERFWAQAAADQAGGLFAADQTQDGGAIPFGTQFFMDDFDDGGGFDDDGFPGPVQTMDEEGDLLAATQEQLKRVRPEFVNYSKRAKRVDVRKLKENIWKGLNIVVDHAAKDDKEAKMDVVPTDPEDGREFGSVVQDLKKTYPKEKLDDISTSFCFICVLHLANEQGLKLDAGEPDETGERRVGELWDLKVFRDPNATASA
ncbi:barren [Calocera viscosa TUFC12733]|uniref:Condensin complex subunit 2 n=1 Tax=Calocera viscosa (strain TUFC12733) TaxID=1330018 RepID=A0A167S6G3_CALVF|nr:barren [Calocera viscosa TUFC12733]